MSKTNGKRKTKFDYSNTFFQQTAKHLTKYEIMVWLYLWNFAMFEDTTHKRLLVTKSVREIGGALPIEHRNISRAKRQLKSKGLLVEVGRGRNMVQVLQLLPVGTKTPTPKNGVGVETTPRF